MTKEYTEEEFNSVINQIKGLSKASDQLKLLTELKEDASKAQLYNAVTERIFLSSKEIKKTQK